MRLLTKKRFNRLMGAEYHRGSRHGRETAMLEVADADNVVLGPLYLQNCDVTKKIVAFGDNSIIVKNNFHGQEIGLQVGP